MYPTARAWKSNDRMKYKNVIISPHIDDAFFSLGGLLLKDRRERQLVVDIFSISSFHKLKLSREKVTQIRKEEELSNAKRLGIDVDFLPFLDGRNDYDLPRLTASISQAIGKHVREGDRIFFPLAISEHMDHVVASLAGLQLAAEGRKRVYFYEDLPYAIKTTSAFSLAQPFFKFRSNDRTFPLINTKTHRGDLAFEYVSYSPGAKFELCKAYESQTTSKILTAIFAYGLMLGQGVGFKERIWRLRSSAYAKMLLERSGLKA